MQDPHWYLYLPLNRGEPREIPFPVRITIDGSDESVGFTKHQNTRTLCIYRDKNIDHEQEKQWQLGKCNVPARAVVIHALQCQAFEGIS